MGSKYAEDAINRTVAKGNMFCSAIMPVHRVVGRCLTAHDGGWLHGLDTKTKVSNGATVVSCACTHVCEGCGRSHADGPDK